MGRISSIIAGVLYAATAIALPGDLVFLADREVRPDEAAGLYYSKSCGAWPGRLTLPRGASRVRITGKV